MLFLSPLVLKERIRKQDVAVVAAVACGALLLLRGSAAEPGSGAAAGNWIALFSGFAWAWTMTALRWAGSQGSTGTNGVSVAALGNLIAFVGCLPMAWWETARPAPVDLAVLLYLGVFQIALAYLCLSRSLRHVRAIEAATILLVEPVLNPVWSWLFRNERPSPAALAGGTMIIFSAFCGTWLQSRNK
jgi:drug/metabolite transporter (DMT)-like permease